MATFAERRTQFANRLFGGTRLLDWISSAKWAVYPRLVRFVQLLAIDGMREILGGARRPAILCEVHPPIKPEDFIAKVEVYGYRVRLLDAALTGSVHDVPVHVLAIPPERS